MPGSVVESGRVFLRELTLALVVGAGYNGFAVWAGSVAGTSELMETLAGSALDPMVWIYRAGTALAIASLLPAFVLFSFCGGRRAMGWALLASLSPMMEPLFYHFENGFGLDTAALFISASYLVAPLAWIAIFRLLAWRQPWDERARSHSRL